jgi:[ribosomal protein S5]-alanine N-acetyltransferase
VELKLKRCTIRNCRLSDAEALAKHANNRNVSINLRDRFPYPYTIEDAKSFLERVVAKAGLEQIFCIDVDGSLVGTIGLHRGEDVHRLTAEFGYFIGEEFWGRGIMSEVIPAFVDYCFKEFSLKRMFAMPHSNNPASARVLEKSGFVLEGRLRNNVVKDGKILDSLLYARTM